jgi:hypothetical protein
MNNMNGECTQKVQCTFVNKQGKIVCSRCNRQYKYKVPKKVLVHNLIPKYPVAVAKNASISASASSSKSMSIPTSRSTLRNTNSSRNDVDERNIGNIEDNTCINPAVCKCLIITVYISALIIIIANIIHLSKH